MEMQRVMRRVFCGVVGVGLCAAVWAQDVAGTWQGTMQIANKPQRMVVKIEKGSDGGWKGLVYDLDSDLAYLGHATTQMSVGGGELRFAIAAIDAVFDGKLSADGAQAAGTWTQGGKTYSLELSRVTGDAAWDIPKATAKMAKDADPDWEVVTVRPTDPTVTSASIRMEGREFVLENRSVETLLLAGYGVHKKQIADAPDWTRTERWDIKGVPDVPGQPSLKQMQSLIRKVLVERFGLQSHTETREMPVYALTVAKGGEKMTANVGDPNGLPDENDRENGGVRTMQSANVSMGDLALILKFFLDRPVLDQTGLTGRYDFRLQWTFDDSRAPADGTAPPSLFTAMQEQLGLKLDAVKAPAEVLVVDKVEKPGAN